MTLLKSRTRIVQLAIAMVALAAMTLGAVSVQATDEAGATPHVHFNPATGSLFYDADDSNSVTVGDCDARPTTVATIATSSVANPTVITTTAPHGLVSGDTVVIAGHVGSTPAIGGAYVVTVTGATTFTIPVNVTVGGTGGTATRTSSATPLVPAGNGAFGGIMTCPASATGLGSVIVLQTTPTAGIAVVAVNGAAQVVPAVIP